MVFRIFSEKKKEYREAAESLKAEVGIKEIEEIRIINRYDVEGIDEQLFKLCSLTVFSEPQIDDVYFDLPEFPVNAHVFVTEYLPGQFDQRADSAAQCISLVGSCERPTVRSAVVYALIGNITSEQLEKVKKYIINPVDSREADMIKPETLKMAQAEIKDVEVIPLSRIGSKELIDKYGLAMDEADVDMLKEYFSSEQREPTMTELKVIDTYWSDHCRHTTFNTEITQAQFNDKKVANAFRRYLSLRHEIGDKKSLCLMDMGCFAAKVLKKKAY